MRRRAARLATTSLALAVIAASSGCLDRPVAPLLPLTTSTETDLLKQTSVDKIDMLLMIDNSSSMADKQAVLAAAVPDLVTGILNPKCVDPSGQAVPNQPAGPTQDCPQGSQREFPPVLDIHVGIITSSLGTFGAFACTDPSVAVCTDLDDHAHLVTRTTPCDPSKGDVPTYQSEGFLAWDPNGNDKPPGIADIGTFTTGLTDLVTGTGQNGCGFEQQNEAWYRFLVDPAPASSFTFNGDVQKVGTDTDLLTQRGEFLRPDSLLAIVVLTDETDVSIKEQSYFPTLAETAFHDGNMISINQLPNARSECTTNGPADPCCSSCGLPTPAPNCPDESGPGQPCDNTPPASFINTADNPAIRAFGLTNGKQSLKARYGIDFLYPTSRYVAALTQTTLVDDQGKSFPNPLLAQRDPSLLFYATITGVPWQLIAHTTNGKADLTAGFMTPKELAGNDPTGQNTYWDDIVGDPDNYVSPKSPFMQESDAPRSGTDPITNITLSMTGMNGLNGHDRVIPNTLTVPGDSRGDIEYACTFPLPTAMQKDCSAGSNASGCDCGDDGTGSNATNPLCAPNPNDSGKPTLQVAAKAYPGVRNLAIVKGMYDSGADTGIVASICPQQFDTPEMKQNGNMVPAANYGYRPAVKAIIDRLKQAIHNQCLARNLPTTNGSAPCIVLEQQPSGDCSCTGTARAVVADKYKQAAVEAQQLAQQLDPGAPAGCFCEITQTTGAALTACQNDPSTSGIDGWCYVDATTVPALGNPDLVAECPANEQRQVRFVGKGTPVPNALTFVTCEGQ